MSETKHAETIARNLEAATGSIIAALKVIATERDSTEDDAAVFFEGFAQLVACVLASLGDDRQYHYKYFAMMLRKIDEIQEDGGGLPFHVEGHA